MIIGNDFEAIMYIRNYQKSDLNDIIFLFRKLKEQQSEFSIDCGKDRAVN